MSRELEQFLRPTRSILKVLWLALMGSVVMYVVVAYLAVPPESPESIDAGPGLDSTVLTALALVAVVLAGLAITVPGWVLPAAKIRALLAAEIDLEAIARHPQTGVVQEERLELLRQMPEPEQRLARLAQSYLTPFIVGMALSESVAILGLVIALLQRDPSYLLPFTGVALLLMFARRPNLDGFLARARRLAR